MFSMSLDNEKIVLFMDEDGEISLNCVLQYAEFLQHDVSHHIVLPHKCWDNTYCITTPAYVKILS